MSDTARQPQLVPFPAPPASNLLPPSVAHPTPDFPLASIDSILAQSIVGPSVVPSTTQPPPVSLIGSTNKEAGPILNTLQNNETTPLVEVRESETLPPEVESWLQKLDAAGEIKLPEPITHDGQVLLSEPEAQVIREKLVLPMSQTSVNYGLKSKVTESARWLAEWCVRLVKMVKGEVKYAPEENGYGKN